MSRATARVAAMQMIYETCAGGEGGAASVNQPGRQVNDPDPFIVGFP